MDDDQDPQDIQDRLTESIDYFTSSRFMSHDDAVDVLEELADYCGREARRRRDEGEDLHQALEEIDG